MRFGLILKNLRLAQGYTQKQTVEQIMGETSYSKIESGKQSIYIEDFFSILLQLECEKIEFEYEDARVLISFEKIKK